MRNHPDDVVASALDAVPSLPGLAPDAAFEAIDVAAPTGGVPSGDPAGRPAWWDDVHTRAASVPAHDVFPTVDELHEAFVGLESRSGGLVTSRRIGTSRLGEAIECFTVAGGPRQMVVVGGVHPNEPIGSLTAVRLVEDLLQDPALRDRLDATWHVVPCIDPDGMRLNEGWLHGPFDRGHYGREFYRPPADEQVEWTFPVAYKDLYFDAMLPETLALKRLLDDTRPELLVTLHNAEMGGAYYYLSRPLPGVYDALHSLPASRGVPLHLGEPEVPFNPVYAPAVFGGITRADGYEFLVGLGLDPTPPHSGGESSGHYAQRYGTVSFVCELPYWSHAAAGDATPSDEPYRDLVVRAARALDATTGLLLDVLAEVDPELPAASPFVRASRAFLPDLAGAAQAELRRAEHVADDRMATVAEQVTAVDQDTAVRLRFGGMLLRALDGVVVSGTATAGARRAHARLAETYAAWVAEADAERLETIPIADLVGIQYATVLATAYALQDEARA